MSEDSDNWAERAEIHANMRDELWKVLRRYQIEHRLSTEELIGSLQTLQLTLFRDNFRPVDGDDDEEEAQQET